MITLYTGSVGSGKSYHAIEIGLDWIKRKYVIANFPLKANKRVLFREVKDKKAEQRWIFWEEITPEKLIAKSLEMGWFGKESSCLVLIDEAGIMFNAREWQTQSKSRNKWIKFLSQSRKFGYDFIFVCQSDRMIDKQIRGLVEYEVKHLKANNSFMFSFLSLFKVTIFMYVYRWYQTKIKSNLRLSRFKKRIAERYDTMRTFDLDELVVSIEKMYSGSIIPAPVLAQLSVWKEEIQRRKEERDRIRKGLYGELQSETDCIGGEGVTDANVSLCDTDNTDANLFPLSDRGGSQPISCKGNEHDAAASRMLHQ